MMAPPGDTSTANPEQAARTPNRAPPSRSRTVLDLANTERKGEPGANVATPEATSNAGG